MASFNIATPSPIRTPSEGPYSLSERINIATRPVHSTLNRLILARLPLALPPHTTNSSTYISGLLHVAPIYITFESLWQSLIDAPSLPTNLAEAQSFPFDKHNRKLSSEPRAMPLMTPPDSPLPESAKVCPRTKFLLTHLRLPGLLRSQRLRNDIRVLSGTPANEIEQQLAGVALRGRLAEFIAHTKRSVGAKPHVLLAYAWVLYMALFSGGRHLRRALKDAGGVGPNFWERDSSPVRPHSLTQPDHPRPRRRTTQSEYPSSDASEPIRHSARSRRSNSTNDKDSLVPGMEFFNFAGEEDGEDIKTLFKSRITEAEVLLTAGEKDDVITEAEHIFAYMVDLISDLDMVMGTRAPGSNLDAGQAPMVSRDSIDLAHERISLASTMHEKLDTAQSTYLSVVTEHYRSLAQMVSRRFVKEGKECPSVSFSRVDKQIPREGELATTLLHGRMKQSRMLPVAAWFLTACMVVLAWQMVL